MKQTHGICGLSVINVYKTPSESSEIVNQLLYGDHFTLIEVKKFWSKIRFEYDGSTGYILNSLYATIDSDLANELDDFSKAVYNRHLTNYALLENQQLLPILIGSRMDIMSILGHENKESEEPTPSYLVETALRYTYAPYMKGGRSPFGIDADGFTQIVYKTEQKWLPRNLEQQAKEGVPLSFLEESTPGDLAFFDDEEGELIHVGILLKNNYIIHAHGCVRIDRIDHTGIFNPHTNQYTHKLRVIKTLNQ